MLIIKNKRLSQDEEKRMEYKVQQKAIRDYDYYNVPYKVDKIRGRDLSILDTAG